jgi:hypothetical protein
MIYEIMGFKKDIHNQRSNLAYKTCIASFGVFRMLWIPAVYSSGPAFYK